MRSQGHGKDISIAVLIAGLSSLVSAFVMWGVEELKARVKKPVEKVEEKPAVKKK